ncbi:hypothetical protein [Variovorax boronicumulans]|uniref:hypothetical protein n=1 Tax=Variovorax boronicumulans TaxID=436515 RepID=UPI002780FC55|nr:hypothetical protein [Variovorax boronicumulans]MDQ0044283.1 hypothetical protein [Variovorax boronicumulans]
MISFKQLTTPAALMDVAPLQGSSDGTQSRMSKLNVTGRTVGAQFPHHQALAHDGKPSSRSGIDGR